MVASLPTIPMQSHYLEKGQLVKILVKWGKGGGPRNVLIQRLDGSKVVRPFRGLRKIKP
jgi:hypothetical protein